MKYFRAIFEVFTYTDRLYPQTFSCSYNTLRVHTYPDFLRFRLPTCIRIRSEFDAKMFESLNEHALMNKLRRPPWQQSTYVSGYPVSLRLQKFPLWGPFKSLRLQCAFSSNTYGRKA